MKVRLKQKVWPESCRRRRDILSVTHAMPFAVNPNGKLIHRVRTADIHLHSDDPSHMSVTYWCGNSCTHAVLSDNPPVNRLLCTFCESRAVAVGEKPADELAGRHVCKGSLKAHRACCGNEVN